MGSTNPRKGKQEEKGLVLKVEGATLKAAKLHSWAVGQPIDCELTVIEHDWARL